MGNADIFMAYGREQLARQRDTNNGLTTKASILLGFGAAILPLAAGAEIAKLNPFLVALVVLIPFFCLALATLKVLRPQPWREGPHFKDVEPYIETSTENGLQLWFGHHYKIAVEKNDEILLRRAQAFRFAAYALSIEIAVVSVILLFF